VSSSRARTSPASTSCPRCTDHVADAPSHFEADDALVVFEEALKPGGGAGPREQPRRPPRDDEKDAENPRPQGVRVFLGSRSNLYRFV